MNGFYTPIYNYRKSNYAFILVLFIIIFLILFESPFSSNCICNEFIGDEDDDEK